MKMEEVQSKLKEIVMGPPQRRRGSDQAGSSFVEDLGADSLDIVELIMALRKSSTSKSPTKTPKSSPPSAKRWITSRANLESKTN